MSDDDCSVGIHVNWHMFDQLNISVLGMYYLQAILTSRFNLKITS